MEIDCLPLFNFLSWFCRYHNAALPHLATDESRMARDGLRKSPRSANGPVAAPLMALCCARQSGNTARNNWVTRLVPSTRFSRAGSWRRPKLAIPTPGEPDRPLSCVDFRRTDIAAPTPFERIRATQISEGRKLLRSPVARLMPRGTEIPFRRQGLTIDHPVAAPAAIWRSSPASGTVMMTVVPRPDWLSISSEPPINPLKRSAKGKPNPVPSNFRARELSICPNGDRAIGMSSADMPIP